MYDWFTSNGNTKAGLASRWVLQVGKLTTGRVCHQQCYTSQVIKCGVEGYDKILKIEKLGGRPVNRPRTWDRRQAKKELEKQNWFRKADFHVPLFVPHTPGKS